jgi:hypothetical protein
MPCLTMKSSRECESSHTACCDLTLVSPFRHLRDVMDREVAYFPVSAKSDEYYCNIDGAMSWITDPATAKASGLGHILHSN